MPLLTVLVVLIVVGFLLWAFQQFVPMDARFKSVIVGLVCLMAFLYVLSALTGRHFLGM